MARVDLPPAEWDRITALMPDLAPRFDEILSLSPDIISYPFHPDSDVPVARTCLLDALGTLDAARYALAEGHAHGIYYREVASPPEQMLAIWFEQFYVQDAAHRLYGAAEDIAEALVMMLEISDARLKRFKERAVSKQTTVGRLLLKERPGLAITASVKALTESAAWKTAMDYRGRLVHEQPPLASGLGIVHRRERRWRKTEGEGHHLSFGGGDKPEVETGALLATCRDALDALLAVWDDGLRQFMVILEEKAGIHRAADDTLVIPDPDRLRLRRSAQAPSPPEAGPAGESAAPSSAS